MRGIVRDCIAELFDRKIIYVFAAVALFGILSTVASRSMEIHFQGNMVGMGGMNEALGNPIIKGFNFYMSMLVFIAVMSTAGLIPNMLAKGSADFFLSKPISRASLLLSKVFGIWIIYGGVMFACFIVNYVVACVVYGMFDAEIIYVIVMSQLVFLVWLSVTVFVGIITGSNAFSIIAAFLVWLAQSVLTFHDGIKRFIGSETAGYIIDTLYYIFPKPNEISDMTVRLATGNSVQSWMPLYSSLIFAVVLFYAAIHVFRRQNY